ALIAAFALTAGCGGDDRLSQDQTASKATTAVQKVNGEFQQVFEMLGRREESEAVPAAVRKRLTSAATVERREADKLAAIKPPTESEDAINDFVRAARSQAATLQSNAARADLTVAEMADAIELPQMRQALTELDKQNLAKPPAHR
ncbi:MAG: hypothetical protein LC798_20350, partial [Chloroflexi bacterium]|nr:hypothetical protein [Chloroflexota bacterium]